MQKDRLQKSLHVTFVGMIANAILAAGKLAAGIYGNSYALVADAVESGADIFSSLIVWRALVVAAEPPDADHPYGHGKAEPIAAALVAGVLLLAAFGIASQALQEILSFRAPPAPFTLIVLLITFVVKEALFRFVSRRGVDLDNAAVQTDAWHHRSDAITSLAAAVGIGIALWGGKGYEKADSIAAIVAAIIIAANGVRLLRPALADLMDTAPSKNLITDIRKVAAQTPGVDDVEKCMVRKMGYQYFVDMHVEVDPEMTVHNAHRIAHLVKDRIRETLPQVKDVLVHIEPRRGDKG